MVLTELVSISLMVVVLTSCGVVNPVTEPTGEQEAVQVKLPPETSGISVALNVAPEQIGDVGVFIRCGVGLTVTATFFVVPLQPLIDGMIT